MRALVLQHIACEPPGVFEDVLDDVLRVGTCSKFLGSLGGFVAGPARYVELIENLGRPYIFTTAPTPASTPTSGDTLRVS